MKKIIVLSLLLVSIAGFSFAEEEKLNTIVITGSRSGLELGNTASTYVVTQSDIIKSSAKDLPEILSKVPGVSIDRNGGRGASASVRVRGSESDQVLILIDGIRTASATSGDTAIQFIPLGQIDRIEIIKGPKSGVYGAEAIGGVIQIFTKNGENSENGYAEFGYGSHRSSTLSAGYNTAIEYNHFGINVGLFQTDGIDRTVNNSGADTDIDAFDQKDISISMGHQSPSGFGVDLDYLLVHGNTEIDSSGADDSTDFKNKVANLSFDYKPVSQVTLNFDVGYSNDYQQTFSANAAIFETSRDTATFYVDYKLGSNQAFILGYDFYDDEVKSSQDFVINKRDNKAKFIEYAVNNAGYILQLAYRRDDNEAYGLQKSGSASLTLPITEKQSLSFSYGTGFKSPTFNDLYYPFEDFGIYGTYVGNPSLKPEKSRSADISYTAQLNSMKLGASLYQTKVQDLIEITTDFNSTVENVSEAEILGGELSFSDNLWGWNSALSISYVDTENKDTGQRLIKRPRGSARFDFDKDFEKLNLLFSFFAEGDRKQTDTTKTSGYALVDVRGLYSVSKKSKVKVSLKNIFDRDYVLIDRFRTYRTEGVTAELSYNYSF